MDAKEFLKTKGITKATCYTDNGGTYYINDLAELLDEYLLLNIKKINDSINEEKLNPTTLVVREAMRIASDDVRLPKFVRDCKHDWQLKKQGKIGPKKLQCIKCGKIHPHI